MYCASIILFIVALWSSDAFNGAKTSRGSVVGLPRVQKSRVPISVDCAAQPDLSGLSKLELKLRNYEIPDKLTLLRVLMIPAFMLTFIVGMKEFALGLYVASCITDFLMAI